LLSLLLSQVGCSVCYYDFTHPGSPKTFDQKIADMNSCYAVATEGLQLSTATQEKRDAAAKDWMACVRQHGYVVVKR
jgi:hypothetical protein